MVFSYDHRVIKEMYEARWEDKRDFACFSNTMNGAISTLLCFVPDDETGCIFIYNNGDLVKKRLKGLKLSNQIVKPSRS